jgi:hypothetical protein
MNLLRVLKGSLDLLLEKPNIFIPNLFASLLYALIELIMIKVVFESILIMQNPMVHPTLEGLQSQILALVGILAVFPLIGAIDLITYSMYPSMVADYHENRRISLQKALKDALSAWRIWLTLGAIFLLFLVFNLLMIGFFAFLTFMFNSLIFLLIGSLLFLFLVVVFMMAIFFVMPVGVIEKAGILKSFRESYRLGFRHRWEVISLNLFIILVIIAAFAFGNIFGTEKLSVGITLLAVALFLFVKIIQSLAYTYICVINPYFYVGVIRHN